MKNTRLLMALLLILLALKIKADEAEAPVELWPAQPVQNARDCILKIVAKQMDITLDPSKPLPTIRVQGEATLQDMQDSYESYAGARPEMWMNFYNPKKNEIFLQANRAYFGKFGRMIYDSLAHELVHYIQVHYQGYSFPLDDPSDVVESTAIRNQFKFRDNFAQQLKGDEFICPEL